MHHDHPHAAVVRAYRPLDALIPPGWTSGSVPAADGTPLAYTRTNAEGSKPPLLLLHGVQVNGLTWLRTAQALAADYDVIMPDARGHGRSGAAADGLTHQTVVDDVRAVLDALGLSEPILIGHSMGADIAGRLAAVIPTRRLVLVDPALVNMLSLLPPMGDTLPDYMLPIVETARSLRALPHAERMVAGLGLTPMVVPWHEADYVTFVEARAMFDFGFFRHTPGLGYLFEAMDVLARITCPVLILRAKQAVPGMPTQEMPPGLVAFQQALPQVQVEEVADSGHFIMFDQFDHFIRRVWDFLRK